MIKAISFDLDDTLWDIWPVVERAEALLHDWLSARYPRITEQFTPLELRGLCGEISTRDPEHAHDRTWLRQQALLLAAQRSGYAQFDVAGAFAVFFIARNAVELFPEVRPTLQRLKSRYSLVTLSNGNADLRMIGIDRLFDFSLSATDVGAAKPHPALFIEACRRLALHPAQIVHVGDDPEHDVLGAAHAGLRTVWLNRNQQNWQGGTRADAEIASLDELATLLAHWKCSSADW